MKILQKNICMEFTRDGRPCKACYSYEDILKLAGKQSAAKEKQKDKSNPNPPNANGPSTSSQNGGEKQPTKSGRREDCPVDKDKLGRSTWDLLHTMSVYYPDNPNEQDKRDMRDMLNSLSKTYPCEHCAADMRDDLKRHPPTLQNRNSFAQWMCEMHNRVNLKLGKGIFDCDRVMERWYDGWKDGSCDS